MKLKNIIFFCAALFTGLGLGAQYINPADISYLSFESVGYTDSGYEVSAIGELGYLDGQATGWIQNTSDGQSSLTGAWFLGPDIGVTSNYFSNRDWSYSHRVPSYLSNIVSSDKFDDYFGVDLDVSTYGFKDSLKKGDILVFSFTFDGTFENLFVEDSPDVILRWQQVGEGFEDSGKTFGTWTDGPFTPVPEPATIGLLSSLGVIGLLMIRRRFKQ